jgi:hypothetical protein
MQNERIGGIKAAAPKNIEELKMFIKLQLKALIAGLIEIT